MEKIADLLNDDFEWKIGVSYKLPGIYTVELYIGNYFMIEGDNYFKTTGTTLDCALDAVYKILLSKK